MNRAITIVFGALVYVLAFATANSSEQVAEKYACVLDGASVFPPIYPYPHPAAGRIDLVLDPSSHELSYEMYDCANLGSVEAHIHGPATTTQLGPVIFTIPPVIPPYEYYRTGVIGVLNDQQIRDLNCGLWYVDIETGSPQYPFGVLRGQLRGLWGWEPAWPCYLATEKTTWGAVKALYR